MSNAEKFIKGYEELCKKYGYYIDGIVWCKEVEFSLSKKDVFFEKILKDLKKQALYS